MSAKEVVSEPANMNVLMLWRMSSSDMRCSGGRSVAALDTTVEVKNGKYKDLKRTYGGEIIGPARYVLYHSLRPLGFSASSLG